MRETSFQDFFCRFRGQKQELFRCFRVLNRELFRFHAFCQCAWSKKEGKNLLVNGSFYIFAAEFVVLAWIQ